MPSRLWLMSAQTKRNKKDPSQMRHGYTTGACATAMTKAALQALVTGKVPNEVMIYLPVGQYASFKVTGFEKTENEVMCETIKDAGDDPDATHQARIQSTVRFSKRRGIHLDGGIGVGRVTKAGLPVPIGEAAINPVPRKMINAVVEEALDEYQLDCGIDVIISVPDGEEIAKKTLNGRLGIIGGISILGTRGIVVPFSSSAYMASIVQAINVAKEAGCDHLVITTGGRSEKYAMKQYPHLQEEAFIEMGDFVGFTLKHIAKKEIPNVSLVGMIGKFSKIAQGIMMVHSKSAPVSFEFLAGMAKRVGVEEAVQKEILQANTASQVADLLKGNEAFFAALCKNCCYHALNHINSNMNVSTTLYTLSGECIGKAENIDKLDENDWYR
ncbi:cobalt-precorrin-5B C(1)-methyltransferase [Robertmurraya siralis]|uniref:Cobalt-precorrin-5B C(1)-methyltransferase n=2 Tax=Bacillaceae TaxID=186817 RepID=A0A919WG84_9BACI|nr:cobalt-precorrin-5B (C(1))-methyltransferase [Robertmurraya siralis]PAE20203.1 cobalt-precorrin-5B (C(1))-methyltransferase [Bacillus sp. 7504-2]GIN61169.1 cobalt-precorrin-5B C(1)-methyltransferase [Robertmurraya siralis]